MCAGVLGLLNYLHGFHNKAYVLPQALYRSSVLTLLITKRIAESQVALGRHLALVSAADFMTFRHVWTPPF
jgi:hypothetical protein